jgi:hypothetical protein
MAAVNVKAVFGIVIDGRMPDGTKVADSTIVKAIELCLDQDEPLGELLYVARFGHRVDGTEAESAERDKALKRLTKLAAPPSERPVDPETVDMVEESIEAAVTRKNRRALSRKGFGHGGPALREPSGAKRPTVDVRRLLEEGARALGYQPDELLRPIAPGRPAGDERARRDALALVVLTARENGGRLAAIGDAIGISKQRVADLEQRGRALAGTTL